MTLQPRLRLLFHYYHYYYFSNVKSICLSVWHRSRGPPAGPPLMRAAGERLIDSLPQPELSPLYSPRLRASRSPPVRAETPCALPCRPPGIQHPGYVHGFFPLRLLVKKLVKTRKSWWVCASTKRYLEGSYPDPAAPPSPFSSWLRRREAGGMGMGWAGAGESWSDRV